MEESGSLYLLDVAKAFGKHAAYLELNEPCSGITKLIASYNEDRDHRDLGVFKARLTPDHGVTHFLKGGVHISLKIKDASGSERTLPLDLTGSREGELIYCGDLDLRGRMPISYEVQIAG